MNKDKIKKIISNILLVMYALVCIAYLWRIVHVKVEFERIEVQYVQKIRNDLYDVVESFVEKNDKETKEYFTIFIDAHPMELIIRENDNEVFSTFSQKDIKSITSIVHIDAGIFRSEETYTTSKQKNYDLLYIVYPPNLGTFINKILLQLIILVILWGILGWLFLLVLQKTMYKPLEEIKHTLVNIRNKIFDDVDSNSKDVITIEFKDFLTDIKKDREQFSEQFSELEVLLLMEKQKIDLLFEIVKGEIHELKTPIHKQLLENEFLLDSYGEIDEQLAMHIKKTIDEEASQLFKIDKLLNDISNDTLDIVNTTKELEINDFVEKIMDEFTIYLKNNDLIIEKIYPEIGRIKVNEIIVKLVIHNLLSNAVKYATRESEIVFEMDLIEKFLVVSIFNETSEKNLQRMSHDNIYLFAEDESYKYSGQNGVKVVKSLLELTNGTFDLEIQKGGVVIECKIPIE